MELIEISHPLKDHYLTNLRDKNTDFDTFRDSASKLSYFLVVEATKHLTTLSKEIDTPLTKTKGVQIENNSVAISVLRAGLGLLEGFVKFLPQAEKGHIGLYRDEQTYKPVEYLFKLPKTKNKKVLVLDPMLATGNSSIAAINLIKNTGVNIKDVSLISLLAAPEGIKNIRKNHPSLHIFTCQIDAKLDKNKFIVPGLGDAGDRYMGT